MGGRTLTTRPSSTRPAQGCRERGVGSWLLPAFLSSRPPESTAFAVGVVCRLPRTLPLAAPGLDGDPRRRLSIRSASSAASLFPGSRCRVGEGCPPVPTDPPKFTSALGVSLGWAGKGQPGAPRARGCLPERRGGGPGRGCRAVGVGSEVRGLGGGPLSPPALGTEVRGPRSRGGSGGFQPGRPSAAVASADAEERSPRLAPGGLFCLSDS